MKIYTLDHARMGHMQRYLDEEGEDEWANIVDMPDIKEYRNTHMLQQIRDLKYKRFPKAIHDQWDFQIHNVTELSHEMYSQYIINEWTSQQMHPNTSWIMIFIEKNHNASYGLCHAFDKVSGALNEAGFKITYVDIFMDDELLMAYDIANIPMPWVIDNETGMAYSIVHLNMSNVVEYFVNRQYRQESPLFYKAPIAMHYKKAQLYMYWDIMTQLYFSTIGYYVMVVIIKLSWINWLPPISFIFDHDGSDLFQFKPRRHFKVFVFICFIFLLCLL